MNLDDIDRDISYGVWSHNSGVISLIGENEGWEEKVEKKIRLRFARVPEFMIFL